MLLRRVHPSTGGGKSTDKGRLLANRTDRRFVQIVHLAVRSLPGAGTPQELMEAAGISPGHIAQAARDLLGT